MTKITASSIKKILETSSVQGKYSVTALTVVK